MLRAMGRGNQCLQNEAIQLSIFHATLPIDNAEAPNANDDESASHNVALGWGMKL